MIWMFFLLALLIPGVADAACPAPVGTVWTALTPSRQDIMDCIAAASAGGTVNVPAGSATWGPDSVAIISKRLTLTGAGIGQTIITDNVTNTTAVPGGVSVGGLVIGGASDTNIVRVSGFTFIKQAAHTSGGIINISGTKDVPDTFRFDHNRIQIGDAGAAGVRAGSWGLIDHNTFDITATGGSIHAIEGHGAGADGGMVPWANASSIGTNRALFIENNDFIEGTGAGIVGAEVVIDGFTGERFVVRYNNFFNCFPGGHGTDSGFFRSVISYEVYGNIFTNNSASEDIRSYTIRGGTGMFHHNTYDGSRLTWGGYVLQYFRDQSAPISTWGFCDGTNWEVSGSTVPGARAVSQGLSTGATTDAAGYGIGATVIGLTATGTGSIKAHDFVGFGASPATYYEVSTGDDDINNGGSITLTGTGLVSGSTIPASQTAIRSGNFRFDNATNSTVGAEGGSNNKYLDNGGAAESGNLGYPCRDQPGVDSPQIHAPLYAFGNAGINGNDTPYLAPFPASNYIQENRDYYNYTASFDGTVGVGVGTRELRPGSCTTGVAYWSTNGAGTGGALDKCTAPNTWTNDSYIPYTYPHPLVGTVASSTPSRRFIPHLNLRHALYDPSLFEWQPDGHIYLVSQ